VGKVKAMRQDRLELAYDRGSMDYYYGRQPTPHIWLDRMGRDVVLKQHMSPDEIKAYYDGYEEETDRKDWG